MTPTRWHTERHHTILRRHPEIRGLFGANPWSSVAIVVLAAFQLGAAAALRGAPWWVVAVAAFCVGAIVAHALGVLIHECAHNLVFRRTTPNLIAAIAANAPLVLPAAIDFREKHMLHHRRLGEGDTRDFQTPTPEAIRWVGRSRIRKAVWLALGAVLFPGRPIENARGARENPWILVNAAVNLATAAIVTAACGARALLYLALSGLFAFGPHVLAMRSYARHMRLAPSQPTNSYYGPGNLVAFNVGYHVEHHDFPAVPWNRLPKVRTIAREAYDDLAHHRSWTALLARFLLRPSYTVDNYVSATDWEKSPDEVRPRLETPVRASGDDRAVTRP
jgi:sphingolipid delta-4 desaturase